jgi:heme a synthase
MSEAPTSPWLHRLAWLTAIIALLPISVGAVVTTVDAGMAFADWPTSHGQGMFAFPWWQSHGDEFLEHGHRLAGALTGFVTLILTATAFMTPSRPAVRGVVIGILLGVIVQGLIGGARVLSDERAVALLHAIFAPIVFSLMAVLIVMTGRGWDATAGALTTTGSGPFMAMLLLLITLSVQYLLGGLLRHLGLAQAWLIHPWFALAVLCAAAIVWRVLANTGVATLRTAGRWVLVCVLAQGVLGLVTWGVRYGFPDWGIIAVQQSLTQVAVRSLHKVLGLLTFMLTVVALARVWQAYPVRGTTSQSPASLSFAGGRLA